MRHRRWRKRNARVISDGRRPAVADCARRGNKDLLRFLTCGSVDDGKSTLIGRLLYDTQLLLEDELAALTRDSRKHGTTGEDIDFALLVDGLEAEREQGITIDVAYRFFTTRQALVHRRRHARPRAIHAQHGDRRLERRAGGDLDRCAQGRADADPAPQLHLRAARHPPRRPGGQQDGSGRLLRRTLSSHRRRLFRFRQGAGIRVDHADPAVGALRRQCDAALAAHTPWYRRRDAARVSGGDRRRRRIRRQAIPLSGAVGEPAEPRFPRLLGHRGVGVDPSGGTCGGRIFRRGVGDRAHRHRRR